MRRFLSWCIGTWRNVGEESTSLGRYVSRVSPSLPSLPSLSPSLCSSFSPASSSTTTRLSGAVPNTSKLTPPHLSSRSPPPLSSAPSSHPFRPPPLQILINSNFSKLNQLWNIECPFYQLSQRHHPDQPVRGAPVSEAELVQEAMDLRFREVNVSLFLPSSFSFHRHPLSSNPNSFPSFSPRFLQSQRNSFPPRSHRPSSPQRIPRSPILRLRARTSEGGSQSGAC